MPKMGITQNFIWTKTFGSINDEKITSLSSQANTLFYPIVFNDSFKIKSISYPGYADSGLYFLNINPKNGTVVKVISPEIRSVINRDYLRFNSNQIANNATALLSNAIILGKKVNIAIDYPILGYDSNGKINTTFNLKLKRNNGFINSWCSQYIIEEWGSHLILAVNGIYQKSDWIYINDDSIKILNNGSSIVIFKISKFGKIFKYNEIKYPLSMLGFQSNYPTLSYLACVMDDRDSFIFNSKIFKNTTQLNNLFFLKIDSNLNLLKINRNPGIATVRSEHVFHIGNNDNYFYSCDIYADTDTMKIKVGGRIYKLKLGLSTIIGYVIGDNLKFIKIIESTDTVSGSQGLNVNFKGEFGLFSGVIKTSSRILPDSLKINTYIFQDENGFAMKLDTFGNVLWYFWNGKYGVSEYFGNSIMNDSFIFLNGVFNGISVFGKDTLISNGGSDAFLTKITDNSIIRGNVRDGPYCAGDSIFIPYRAYGKYEDTNTFFAELSDENGNFYGTPRVLGKLKAKGSGTVRGVLPLFDVLSSRNYRIRIRSNSPFVQSFMRYDSLHLLVYSKDKANPGKDTTICYGNKVKIAAKGGTLWHWSPGTAVQDSTARQTYFTGLKTTKLKITISDSSGCGKPDTAYQTITVLPPPMVQNPDTVVCANTPIQIVAKSTGGYRPGIKHYWYKDTIFLFKDTLKTILNSDTVFTLIADDGCSAVKGVASIRIQLAAKPKIANKDTTACKNLPFTLKGKTQKKSAVGVKYTWQVGNTKTQADTVKWTLDKDSSLKLIAYDLCAAKSDTATLKISVFSKPNFTYSVDSICAKNGHQIKLKPSGGKAPYTFYENNINTDSVFTVATKWQQKIVLQTIDNCQQKADSIKIELLQIPTANMQVAPNITGCVPLQLYFKTNNPKGAKVQWINAINNAQFGNLDTASFVFSQSGTNAIRIVQTNGICADSTQKTITLFPKPIADFDPNRTDYLITENQSLIINKSQGGNKFNWYWQNFSHTQFQLDTFILKFNDTGKIQVRLVAYNSYGCTDTAKKFIYVHPTPLIFFPTGITANHDGLNETFYPQGIGIKTYRLIIINRWGQDVFRGKANEAWETNEDILPGIYIYRCVYTNWQGKAFEKKGVVEVVK